MLYFFVEEVLVGVVVIFMLLNDINIMFVDVSKFVLYVIKLMKKKGVEGIFVVISYNYYIVGSINVCYVWFLLFKFFIFVRCMWDLWSGWVCF